jgi:hypothetical protein
MCTQYIKSLLIGAFVLFGASCSYVDYIDNSSINVEISGDNFVEKEVRKGTPLTFQLFTATIDPDFPCIELKREFFIDNQKIVVPDDTGVFQNSIKVNFSTSNLLAGEHTLKIRVTGCNDLDFSKNFKFIVKEGLPPVAKITKTRLTGEPGKSPKLKIFIHYTANSNTISKIKILWLGQYDSPQITKPLDSLIAPFKSDGDTSLSVYLYQNQKYNLKLVVEDNISANTTDELDYDYNFKTTLRDTVIISKNTTWDLANGPYVIYGKLIIDGAKLTIDPGVFVRMGFDASIVVQNSASSSLVAEGTLDDPIYFSRQYIKCNGIEINSASVFKHCKLGLAAKINVNNSAITLENCKADSIVLDKTSTFNTCNGNQIDYLSISALQSATIGVNNTIIKQDITNKK